MGGDGMAALGRGTGNTSGRNEEGNSARSGSAEGEMVIGTTGAECSDRRVDGDDESRAHSGISE